MRVSKCPSVEQQKAAQQQHQEPAHTPRWFAHVLLGMLTMQSEPTKKMLLEYK